MECVGKITYLPSVSNVFRGALGGGCALNTAKAHKTLGSWGAEMTALSYISKALEGSHLRNSKNSAKANLGSQIFTLNLKYQKNKSKKNSGLHGYQMYSRSYIIEKNY